jgi:hypothetical protein
MLYSSFKKIHLGMESRVDVLLYKTLQDESLNNYLMAVVGRRPQIPKASTKKSQGPSIPFIFY